MTSYITSSTFMYNHSFKFLATLRMFANTAIAVISTDAYLKLAAKVVCNHGDNRNPNQCDGG